MCQCRQHKIPTGIFIHAWIFQTSYHSLPVVFASWEASSGVLASFRLAGEEESPLPDILRCRSIKLLPHRHLKIIRTPSIVRKKRWKQVILTMYYDRTLLLFSRPMRDKDTSALREMFQYSSLAEKPLDQWEIATDWRASSLWPSFRPNQI